MILLTGMLTTIILMKYSWLICLLSLLFVLELNLMFVSFSCYYHYGVVGRRCRRLWLGRDKHVGDNARTSTCTSKGICMEQSPDSTCNEYLGRFADLVSTGP